MAHITPARVTRYLAPRLFGYLFLMDVLLIWSETEGIPPVYQHLCHIGVFASIILMLGTVHRLMPPSPTDVVLGRARPHPLETQTKNKKEVSP